jgi:alginate O-acetyltransferase complex protein AlgI
MIFSSVTFLFFFLPIVMVLYFLMRNRPLARNLFLIFASLIFYYLGDKAYTILLLVMMGMNYGFGLWIAHSGRWGRAILIFSIICNLAPLIFFKYMNFIVSNINIIVELLGAAPIKIAQIYLPIGLSFYTFVMLGYIIDIYRDMTKAEKNPVSPSLFFAMFPKLLQGPIPRYANMAKEMLERHVSAEDFSCGVRRFIIGLGKKMIIANTITMTVDRLFATPANELSAGVAWLAVFAYLMSLYYDFSGYTDMAIGIGRMFGFTLPENFNYPFMSTSMRVFWQRWHITLMSWFRDYVYFPMGGSRVNRVRHYANLLFVFVLTGLWHGSSWCFILWGLMNGVLLVIEQLLPKNFFDRLWRPIGIAYVNLAFILQAVFFRSSTVDYAMKMFAAMFGLNDPGMISTTMPLVMNTELGLAVALGLIGYGPVIPFMRDRIAAFVGKQRGASGSILRFAQGAIITLAFTGIIILSYMAIASETFSPFLYGQF